jgi:plastocyanin
MYLFLWGGRRASTAVAASAALVVALVAAGCGSGGAAGDGPAGSADVTVEVAASEYEFSPSTLSAPAGAIAFHVTNTGSEEHEFEIFRGDQVVDEIEGLVPGLDRTLTVTLDAGDYTYVCKLAGHDAAGMTGTLTVTPS